MVEKRTRSRKKFSNPVLFLVFVFVFSFGGFIAYIYFQYFEQRSSQLPAQSIPQTLTNPRYQELRSNLQKLYLDQRTTVEKLVPLSSGFIVQSFACLQKIPNGISAAQQTEFQNLVYKQRQAIESMSDASRNLIAGAFNPFFGFDLDEKSMAHESLAQQQRFMKAIEVKQYCVTGKDALFGVEQQRLVEIISNNADKAKNLIIRYNLDLALEKSE